MFSFFVTEKGVSNNAQKGAMLVQVTGLGLEKNLFRNKWWGWRYKFWSNSKGVKLNALNSAGLIRDQGHPLVDLTEGVPVDRVEMDVDVVDEREKTCD